MESNWTAVEIRTGGDARDGTDLQRAPELVVVVGQAEQYILFERARDEPRLLRAQRHPAQSTTMTHSSIDQPNYLFGIR